MDSKRVVTRNGFPTKATVEMFCDEVKLSPYRLLFNSPYGKNEAGFFFTQDAEDKVQSMINIMNNSGIEVKEYYHDNGGINLRFGKSAKK